MFERIYLAPNNGAIGGGEVMLLRIADALRSLAVDFAVVAPQPSAILDAAREAGHPVIALAAADRRQWMRALRRWDRTRPAGLLWCNGLVPSFATSGRHDRIVHIHQHPLGMHRLLARVARWRAVRVLVPSEDMRRSLPGASVLWNWTADVPSVVRTRRTGEPTRVGVLGRLGIDKGVHVVAEAMQLLDEREAAGYRLVLGGEPLFVSDEGVAQMERALESVSHLTERTGWTDAARFFEQIDLLVVPSIVRESFGLVAAEAMAAQVPLIVSDAGALPEVVGEAGDVVAAGDPGALADRIAAIARDAAPHRTEELHERWRREFSPDAGRERVRALVDVLGVLRGG